MMYGVKQDIPRHPETGLVIPPDSSLECFNNDFCDHPGQPCPLTKNHLYHTHNLYDNHSSPLVGEFHESELNIVWQLSCQHRYYHHRYVIGVEPIPPRSVMLQFMNEARAIKKLIDFRHQKTPQLGRLTMILSGQKEATRAEVNQARAKHKTLSWVEEGLAKRVNAIEVVPQNIIYGALLPYADLHKFLPALPEDDAIVIPTIVPKDLAWTTITEYSSDYAQAPDMAEVA